MDETSVTTYITETFPGVETTTAYGYTFFFYDLERMLPFATLAVSDNEYDRVSNLDRPGVYRMSFHWGSIIWQQFGAALDLLDDVIRACPEALWRDVVWDDPDGQEYGEFWFIVYHTLAWTDRYLSRAGMEFKPPTPFITGALPEKPYTKEQLLTYLAYCRRKCRQTLEALDDEQAFQPYVFPWGGEMPFAELMLYTMRHAQEHAAQLSLHLGRKTGAAPDWVSRARNDAD